MYPSSISLQYYFGPSASFLPEVRQLILGQQILPTQQAQRIQQAQDLGMLHQIPPETCFPDLIYSTMGQNGHLIIEKKILSVLPAYCQHEVQIPESYQKSFLSQHQQPNLHRLLYQAEILIFRLFSYHLLFRFGKGNFYNYWHQNILSILYERYGLLQEIIDRPNIINLRGL